MFNNQPEQLVYIDVQLCTYTLLCADKGSTGESASNLDELEEIIVQTPSTGTPHNRPLSDRKLFSQGY